MQINAYELNTRHNEYLTAVRKAVTRSRGDVSVALASVKDAQDKYASWFAERGVELVFPEEAWQPGLYARLLLPTEPGYPVQEICHQVRDTLGRPVAAQLIKEYGKADFLAAVNPENFAALIEACDKALKK